MRLTLHPVLTDYLTQLVATGLYGNTVEEAASRLIASGVSQQIERGSIPARTTPVQYPARPI